MKALVYPLSVTNLAEKLRRIDEIERIEASSDDKVESTLAGNSPKYRERVVRILRQALCAFQRDGVRWANRVADGRRLDKS